MSLKQKWYRPALMLRAGKPRHYFGEVHAMLISDGEATLIGSAKSFVLDRDGIGIPKSLARITAGIQPHRLTFIRGSAEHAGALVNQLNEMVPREFSL